MTTSTADPAQPTPSTVVVATDGSVTVTQVSNATTVTYPGLFPVQPFSPLDLSPTLWVDSSDETTITESGGAVSQWDDKSGNGYDLTQATGAYQPTTGTRTLNGLNVLFFDSNDSIENATIATSNQFVVFIISDDDAISGTARFHIRGLTALSPIVGIVGGTNYRIYQGSYLDQGTAATGPKLWRAVFDTTDTLHIDGVSQVSGSGGTLTTTGLRFGSSSGSTYAIYGAMAEIIVVDGTLTAQQISDTETYLAEKWGITL